MITYVTKVVRRNDLRSSEQAYYAHSKQHPAEEQLWELERQGYEIVGVGRIVITIHSS
jgi:hypothetical protein